MSTKIVKEKLGKYIKMFNLPAKCKTLDEVTPKAKFSTFVINCGANCSQYTLKTRFGYSVLDMLDERKDMELYITKCHQIIFSVEGSFKICDETCLVDNDNYGRVHDSKSTIIEIIKTRKEWVDFLRVKGYQVYPPRPFCKPSGDIRNFRIYSVKGIMDNQDYLNSIK